MARRKRMQGFLKRSGVWHVRTDPVTGKQKSTGCRDEEAALLWRAERERLAANPALQAAKTATVGEWVRKFLAVKEAAHKAKTLSAGALQNIRSKLAQVVRVLGADRALSMIDTNVIDAYIATRRGECGHGEKAVGDYTIARELQKLFAVLRHAKRRGCFPGDIEALKPEVEDLDGSYTPRERAPTEDEVVRLTVAMPTRRWASVVAVCVALGCRLSEALRLAPEDIDLDAGVVWIDGRKTEGANRTLPIISGYRGLLEAAMPELPIGKLSNFDRTFKIACKRAGIAHCSPNDLRRTHSTLLGARGVPDDMVARLLGHKTTTLAKRTYNRVKAMQLAPVAERILATAEPLLLPGETVQIRDEDRRKSRNHAKSSDDHRPPEPKVVDSNSTWRADNPQEVSGSGRANPRQLAPTGAVTHTDSRQSSSDAERAIDSQNPARSTKPAGAGKHRVAGTATKSSVGHGIDGAAYQSSCLAPETGIFPIRDRSVMGMSDALPPEAMATSGGPATGADQTDGQHAARLTVTATGGTYPPRVRPDELPAVLVATALPASDMVTPTLSALVAVAGRYAPALERVAGGAA